MPGTLSETRLPEHVEAIFGANCYVVWWFIPVVFQKMVQVIFRVIYVTCLLYRSLKGQLCNVWEEWFEVQNYTAPRRVVYRFPFCCASFIQWRFSCQHGGVRYSNDMAAVCIWVLVTLFLVVLCSVNTLYQYIRTLTFSCCVGCASHLNQFFEFG